MKILVCISKTPDTTSKISFKENNTVFSEDGVSFIMNPYDEWYALVRAIEIVEANGGEVVVINVGPAENDIIIRKALAIGADRAVRVDRNAVSSYQVAEQISEYARTEAFDIIFTGKETIDYNGSEVGAMIAEFMGMPFISYASKLEVNAGMAEVTRDIEGGVEGIKLSFPFVVSAAKGMAEQRIPNMRGIMMAKKKPLEILRGVESSTLVTLKGYELPEVKSGVKMVEADQMDELVRLLHEEAKVI